MHHTLFISPSIASLGLHHVWPVACRAGKSCHGVQHLLAMMHSFPCSPLAPLVLQSCPWSTPASLLREGFSAHEADVACMLPQENMLETRLRPRNDGITNRFEKGYSAPHRAGHTRCSKAGSLEMGDLSAAQATNFLQRQGVADKDAARVVDVAGGRLLHLLAAVDVLHRGGSAEGAHACGNSYSFRVSPSLSCPLDQHLPLQVIAVGLVGQRGLQG